ncbi:RsfA family transcriptional regulator [Alteribacillus sp. HJP-4]|uniref:RsfA family transcriptional regulator n=1 Tax=Alteribacillus sp. HJP-4 TaxID=2775394 RepID=UPI0035CD31C1
MVLPRQDAWSADDDILLAEIVLRHVREGNTQLSAFQEAGNRLSRTAAACGFRWNAYVRKKYEAALEIAKSQKTKPAVEAEVVVPPETPAVQKEAAPKTIVEKPSDYKERLEETITFLKEIAPVLQEENLEVKKTEEKNNELLKKNEKLEKEISSLKKDFEQICEDYKAMLGVMEKARALSEGALPFLRSQEDEKRSS